MYRRPPSLRKYPDFSEGQGTSVHSLVEERLSVIHLL